MSEMSMSSSSSVSSFSSSSRRILFNGLWPNADVETLLGVDEIAFHFCKVSVVLSVVVTAAWTPVEKDIYIFICIITRAKHINTFWSRF